MDYIQIIEIIAATIGIVYVVLELRASMWLWPVGIILPLFYIYISWISKVYGNIFVNVYYLLACIWGWWMWARKRAQGGEADLIKHTDKQTLLRLLGITASVTVSISFLFARYTDSPVPLADAVATSVSMVGMWLLGKKYIETWHCWILSNALYSVIFFSQSYYVTAGFFLLYTFIAILGWREWNRMLRLQESPSSGKSSSLTS